MLVLGRKVDESIVIGDNIMIKVVSVENGVVKLGIQAPIEIPIIRSELLEEVREKNRAAVHKADRSELDALSRFFRK